MQTRKNLKSQSGAVRFEKNFRAHCLAESFSFISKTTTFFLVRFTRNTQAQIAKLSATPAKKQNRKSNCQAFVSHSPDKISKGKGVCTNRSVNTGIAKKGGEVLTLPRIFSEYNKKSRKSSKMVSKMSQFCLCVPGLGGSLY